MRVLILCMYCMYVRAFVLPRSVLLCYDIVCYEPIVKTDCYNFSYLFEFSVLEL